MGIGTTLQSSVSGLKAVEKQISVVAGNISNANTPGYTRQRALIGTNVVAGDVQGVSVLGIKSSINENLNAEIRSQSGTLSEQNTLKEFYDQIELAYGSPGITPGITDKISDFFDGIQALSDNPETLSLRQNVVRGAEELTDFISGAVQSLHDLRFEADRQIKETYDTVNTLIARIDTLNTQVVNFQPGTGGFEAIRREQNNTARELAEYMEISLSTSESGQYAISGPGGAALVDSRPYLIEYSASASVQALAEDSAFDAAELVQLRDDGTPSVNGTRTVLVSSGKSSEVTSDVSTGKLRALLDMRDKNLPELIAQFDSLAKNLKDDINAAHNDGGSFPPPTELTGNRRLLAGTEVAFSGTATIQLLQSDGSPAPSPYPGEVAYQPLNLNFESLKGSDGTYNIRDIANEINGHFGSPSARASVGPLNNVALVLKDDAIADGGSASFSLEYSNLSTDAASVEIISVQTRDPIDNSTLYPAVTVPSSAQNVAAGAVTQHADSFTVDFGTDDNRDAYRVDVTVRVTDKNGDTHESVIAYSVEDDVTDSLNTRFPPQSQSVTSGDGAYTDAPSGSTTLRAEIIDADGNPADENEPGVLRLQTSNGLRFAISEGDSSHISTQGQTGKATEKGFSAFFGLNDLFISGTEASDDPAGQALNLDIRADIIKDPTKISVGRLQASPQPADTTQASYTFEYGSGNNSALLAIAETSTNVSLFSATDGLPEVSATFSTYAVSITSYMATEATLVTKNQDIEQFTFDGLLTLNQELTGVDVDSELAFILELENQYTASAKVISTMQSMMDTLTGIFR